MGLTGPVGLPAQTEQAVPAHEAAHGLVRDAHPFGQGALSEALIQQGLDVLRGVTTQAAVTWCHGAKVQVIASTRVPGHHVVP